MPYRIRDLQQLLDAPDTPMDQHRAVTAMLATEREKAKAHFDQSVGSTWARLTTRVEDFDEGVPQRGGIPAKPSIGEVTSAYKQLAKDADILDADEYKRRMSELDTAMNDLTELYSGMRRDVDAIGRVEGMGVDAYYDEFLDRNPAILARGERAGFDYEAG